MKCPECNGENLIWEDGTTHEGGVTDGNLRQNEVSGIFILGCGDCSETIGIVSASDVADFLNSQGIRSLMTECEVCKDIKLSVDEAECGACGRKILPHSPQLTTRDTE